MEAFLKILAAKNPLGKASDLDIPKAQAGLGGTIDNIISALLFLAGGLSVIFIIIGGLMYIFSAGNADTAKKARSILIYSLIGLVVTIMAYAIVKLVLTVITGGNLV